MLKLKKDRTEQQIIKTIVARSKTGTYDGKDLTEYFYSCRFWIEKHNALLIFTRDVGHHSAGWWKNPDYERCYHLSLSFVDRFSNDMPHKKKDADKVVKMLFGSNSNLVWCEPPYSDTGIKKEVWHYRLFCDENWKAIKPRGEVYSTQFTEKGWLSFSELKNKY